MGTHYHDTDSPETGWCSGCGRTDLAAPVHDSLALPEARAIAKVDRQLGLWPQRELTEDEKWELRLQADLDLL